MGLLLRNNVYDGLDPVKDSDAVGFDDLTLVITMRKLQDIGDRVREATEWCADMDLHLAPDKTEIILLTAKRVRETMNVEIGRTEKQNKSTVKYLGALDNARTYSPH